MLLYRQIEEYCGELEMVRLALYASRIAIEIVLETELEYPITGKCVSVVRDPKRDLGLFPETGKRTIDERSASASSSLQVEDNFKSTVKYSRPPRYNVIQTAVSSKPTVEIPTICCSANETAWRYRCSDITGHPRVSDLEHILCNHLFSDLALQSAAQCPEPDGRPVSDKQTLEHLPKLIGEAQACELS